MTDPGLPAAGDIVQVLAGVADFVRRRFAGDYAVDPESGFDPELNRAVLMPVARALYQGWFRVRMRGLENVPSAGPALVSGDLHALWLYIVAPVVGAAIGGLAYQFVRGEHPKPASGTPTAEAETG